MVLVECLRGAEGRLRINLMVGGRGEDEDAAPHVNEEPDQALA